MRMNGEARIAAPRDRVWQALNDPEILRQCVPGCQSLDKESDDRLRAVVEVKIGPIGARFNGSITLSDIDAPNGYTISGSGQAGVVGSASGGARVRLADDGTGTLLTYEVDAQVGGRLAQLGGPIIDATAKQLAGKFFNRFGEVIGGPAAAPAVKAAEPVTAVAEPIPSASRLPIAWIPALIVGALLGFLLGQEVSGVNSGWFGLAAGLLVVIVAGTGFLLGRRSAPTVVLDRDLLSRLERETRQ